MNKKCIQLYIVETLLNRYDGIGFLFFNMYGEWRDVFVTRRGVYMDINVYNVSNI